MSLNVRKIEDGIQIAATIQPRASRNRIDGLHNGALKIRLTSPPVDGAANKACVRFLAKCLGLSPANVSIVRGLTSRNKTLNLLGLNEAILMEKLAPHLSRPAASKEAP